MLAILLLASAVSGVAQMTQTPFEYVEPAVAAKQVSECGFGKVSIRFDDLLQEHILSAPKAENLSDEQLSCADKAASVYTLDLSPDLQVRFDKIRERRFAKYLDAQNLEWVNQRGLADKIPKFDPETDDPVAFALRIEGLCGPKANGALQSAYGPNAISPDWIIGKKYSDLADALICLTNVARFADFKLNLIGNEEFRQ